MGSGTAGGQLLEVGLLHDVEQTLRRRKGSRPSSPLEARIGLGLGVGLGLGGWILLRCVAQLHMGFDLGPALLDLGEGEVTVR